MLRKKRTKEKIGQYGVWEPLFARQWMKGWGNRRHLLKTSAQRSFFQTWKKRYFVLSWDLILFRFTTAVPTKKSECTGFTDLKQVILKHGKKGKRGVIIYKTNDEGESDIEELRFGEEMYDAWCQRFFQGSSGWMRSVGFCTLGSLRLTLDRAKDLHTEKGGVPSSFCKIFVGGIPMGVTPTVKDTVDPLWRHEVEMHFLCFVRKPEIRIDVYTQNAVFDSTYLGTCVFPLVEANGDLVKIPCERWLKVADSHHCEYDTEGMIRVSVQDLTDRKIETPERSELLYANKPGKSHYKHTGRTAFEVVNEMYGRAVWEQMDVPYMLEHTSLKSGRGVAAEELVVASFPSNECAAFDTPTHLMMTSTRMVFLLDRVGPNHGCLTASKPSIAATRPEIFSVPIAAIESWKCSVEETKVGAVLSLSFKLTGSRSVTVELGPVDEYVGERNEMKEAMEQLTQTHLEGSAGPSRSSICSSSFRRLASTTSRLRFDSGAMDINMGRGSAKLKKIKTTSSKAEQSVSKRGQAGEKLLRHHVFAMVRQWLVSLNYQRALLTTSHVASIEERTYYDVLNVVRDEIRDGAKSTVVEALRNRSEELRHRAMQCDSSTMPRRWKLWEWTYDPVKEFTRLGVGRSSCRWKLTDLNKNYEFSPTYPKVLATLKGRNKADPDETRTVEELLRLSARGRSKARVIGLTWLHPHTRAPLLRCAQPLVGGTFKVTPEDEKVVLAIQATTPGSKPLLIADCRSYLAASANLARGGGFENVNRLHNKCEIDFFDIGNIHVVRKSLQKVFEAEHSKMDPTEKDSNNGYQTEIVQSGWLAILSDILCGAVKVVESLENGVAVICHCSDGWDRTSQICALAQIMLDPHYRTIEGFATLVEKDWCSFGHKFHDRCMSLGKEWSPVFLQFLDCVYQLHCQFPRYFEFNIELLVLVAEAALTGAHGNFLFNNEKDRHESLVETCTNNIWDFALSERDRFMNPLFDHAHLPSDASRAGTNVIRPEFCVRSLRLCKPLLVRMPVYRNGSLNLDIDDVVRNLLFGATGRQLADAMGLCITPHGLLMAEGSSKNISRKKKSGLSLVLHDIPEAGEEPEKDDETPPSRYSHRRTPSAVAASKKTSIGQGWFMCQGVTSSAPFFFNRKTNARQSEWPEELGMPPKELFPPPPNSYTRPGMKPPPPPHVPKTPEMSSSSRPARLNLTGVSPWNTQRTGSDNLLSMTLQRDQDGNIGIRFDDDLRILAVNAWAQRFGIRVGQQIVECEGHAVSNKPDLVRYIPGSSTFMIVVKCASEGKGVSSSSSNDDDNDDRVRNVVRGKDVNALLRHLKNVGVGSRVISNVAAEDMTGDDFANVGGAELEMLGVTEKLHRRIVEGRMSATTTVTTGSPPGASPRRVSQCVVSAAESSANRRKLSRGGSPAGLVDGSS
eukprot:g4855.t1